MYLKFGCLMHRQLFREGRELQRRTEGQDSHVTSGCWFQVATCWRAVSRNVGVQACDYVSPSWFSNLNVCPSKTLQYMPNSSKQFGHVGISGDLVRCSLRWSLNIHFTRDLGTNAWVFLNTPDCFSKFVSGFV